MKIDVFIDRIANRSGGAEKVAVSLADELSDLGHDVTIVTWEPEDRPPFYPVAYGVKIVNLMPYRLRRSLRRRMAVGNGASSGGSPMKLVNKVRSAANARLGRMPGAARLAWMLQNQNRVSQIRKFFRTTKPDIAIALLPSSFPHVIRAAEGTGVMTVASCHNVPERDFEDLSRWSRNLYDIEWRKESLRHADAVTCLLPKFVPWFRKAGCDKPYVIPNFVDLPEKERKKQAQGPKVIVAVGRLSHQKDHATLLRAWKLLEKDYPDWEVHIYGDGPLKDALCDLQQSLGLENRVAFQGVTTEIEDVYLSSDVFVIPSIHEGFGLVTVEAMAAGLPCVGFADCDGTNDLIEDGVTGLLAEPSNTREAPLAESLKRLLDDPALRERLGRAGFEKAKTFSRQQFTERWKTLIGDIAPKRAKSTAKEQFEAAGSVPEISILIPVYNGLGEIEKSLESALNQDFDKPFEVIVCDDGSTDGTVDYLAAMAEKDSRVRLLRNERNMGRPFSRQKLLESARGRYITWLDADDVKYAHFLSATYGALKSLEERNPGRPCLVYCDYDVCFFEQPGTPRRTHRRLLGKDFLVSLLEAKVEGYLWAFLMPSRFARMAAFDTSLPRLQDLDYFIQLALYRPAVERISTAGPLCLYNKRDGGRKVADIDRAWDYIYRKYEYVFKSYGRMFILRYKTHAKAVSARYAKRNGQWAASMIATAEVVGRRAALKAAQSMFSRI